MTNNTQSMITTPHARKATHGVICDDLAGVPGAEGVPYGSGELLPCARIGGLENSPAWGVCCDRPGDEGACEPEDPERWVSVVVNVVKGG